MNLRIVTRPTAEPLTLGEAMEAMNIALDDRHQDAWFNRKIVQARQAAEEFLCIALTDAVYEYRIHSFWPYRSWNADYFNGAYPWWWDPTRFLTDCGGIALPLGHAGTVTGITYIDTDGAEQTLDPATYVLDDNPRAPVVRLAYGQSWPSARSQANAVVITFQGVYSETSSPPNSVPELIKGGMEMMLSSWNEDREGVAVTPGAASLMQPYRLGMGV